MNLLAVIAVACATVQGDDVASEQQSLSSLALGYWVQHPIPPEDVNYRIDVFHENDVWHRTITGTRNGEEIDTHTATLVYGSEGPTWLPSIPDLPRDEYYKFNQLLGCLPSIEDLEGVGFPDGFRTEGMSIFLEVVIHDDSDTQMIGGGSPGMGDFIPPDTIEISGPNGAMSVAELFKGRSAEELQELTGAKLVEIERIINGVDPRLRAKWDVPVENLPIKITRTGTVTLRSEGKEITHLEFGQRLMRRGYSHDQVQMIFDGKDPFAGDDPGAFMDPDDWEVTVEAEVEVTVGIPPVQITVRAKISLTGPASDIAALQALAQQKAREMADTMAEEARRQIENIKKMFRDFIEGMLHELEQYRDYMPWWLVWLFPAQ